MHGPNKPAYELADQARGTAHGAIGMIAAVVGHVELAAEIDSSLHLFEAAQALLRVRPCAQHRLQHLVRGPAPGRHRAATQRPLGLLRPRGVPGQHPRTLVLGLLGANRLSLEGVVGYYQRAIGLVRAAVFNDVVPRGDTDFSLTAEFDRWNSDGVRFVFGYDAKANLINHADAADENFYHQLAARADRALAERPRTRPRKVKDDVVRAREFKVLRQKTEDIVEFDYQPGKCKQDYRVVALRKTSPSSAARTSYSTRSATSSTSPTIGTCPPTK